MNTGQINNNNKFQFLIPSLSWNNSSLTDVVGRKNELCSRLNLEVLHARWLEERLYSTVCDLLALFSVFSNYFCDFILYHCIYTAIKLGGDKNRYWRDRDILIFSASCAQTSKSSTTTMVQPDKNLSLNTPSAVNINTQ